jgi:lactococcin 972 family bacteriocin
MQKRAIAGLFGLLLVGALCAPVAASAAEPADGTAPGGLPVASSDEGPTGGGVLLPEGEGQLRYTSHPEGGTWNHGTVGRVTSDYYHPSRTHGSSVKNGRGNAWRSPDVGGGAWARSSIAKTAAGNSAYWRIS